MRLLITGATGFVGSHVVEELARRGLEARALVRRTSAVDLLERWGVERAEGDITDPDSLRRAVAGTDAVLHLAAATRALGPRGFRRVNAEGTRNVVEAAAGADDGHGRPRRLVYLSSLAAVGPSRERPVTPDDDPRPISAYGRSKLEGERAVLDADERVSAAIIRAPAVYGPRDRDLLPFFRLASMGILPVIGDGGRQVQLVHARDLAGALVSAAAGSDARGIFHVAEPSAYTWEEVLSRMAAAVGRDGRRIPVPALVLKAAGGAVELASRIVRRPTVFDRDKAREILAPGWTCETEGARAAFGLRDATPLADGLRETAKWYRTAGWL